MSESPKKRNEFVDIMRGIAMLLVVLGHTMTGCTENSQDSFLFNVVWSLQMPLFILISGYVTRYSRGVCDGDTLWIYVKRRTIAYLLPWAVWSFLVRGIIFGQRNFLNLKWLIWQMDSGYWFLFSIWTICIFFGLSQFLAIKIKRGPKQMWTFLFYVIGMGVLAAIGFVAGFSFLSIKLTLYYMPYFYVGYLYGHNSSKILKNSWGKNLGDNVVSISVVAWLFIIIRYQIYALPDSGMAIMVRIASSMTGCIAVCGLCHAVFENTSKVCFGRDGNYRRASKRRVLNARLTAEFTLGESEKRYICRKVDSNNESDSYIERHNHSQAEVYNNSDVHYKQDDSNHVFPQKWLAVFLDWAGTHSLEIYMIHGFVLNLLKAEALPRFSSIAGLTLTASNFTITVFLCWVVIKLISANKRLRTVLSLK